MENKPEDKKLRDYFRRQDDVEFALIFGSTAVGRTTPMSDIDVGVYLRNGEDALKMAERQIDITCAIMQLYRISQVDVVILNIANPFLGFQVLKDGRVVYVRDEKEFYKFKAVSLGRYQDIRPMYDLYDRIAEESLRRERYG